MASTHGRDVKRTAIHTWPRREANRHPHMAAIRRRCGSRQNRIKASLRAFQRGEVKVLGFGVKARLRPQRMALRRLHVPFALVGANGKACGEALGVLVFGTPPISFFLGGGLFLILGIVLVCGYKKSTPCGVLGVWWVSGSVLRLGCVMLLCLVREWFLSCL